MFVDILKKLFYAQQNAGKCTSNNYIWWVELSN
jgi:hypothetical protein